MCEFCEHHKPLLTYHYDSIYTEIRLINKTQLDAMTTVTDQRGKLRALVSLTESATVQCVDGN
jgi:hypothetical protein